MMESIIQSVNVIQHEEEVDHSTDYYDKYYNYYISDKSYYSEWVTPLLSEICS